MQIFVWLLQHSSDSWASDGCTQHPNKEMVGISRVYTMEMGNEAWDPDTQKCC